MSKTDELSEAEKKEVDDWMAEVAAKSDLIEGLQDELAESPEFGTLVASFTASKGESRNRALRSMADYAVLFVAERMWKKE